MTFAPRTASRLATLVGLAALACTAGSRAHAQTAPTLEEAADALVDLNALFQRATEQVPLSAALLDTYLVQPFPVPVPVSAQPDAQLEAYAGVGVELFDDAAPSPAARPPEQAPRERFMLPIVRTSAADARVLSRRQAFLGQYLRKHSAFTKVVRDGKVPEAKRTPVALQEQYASQANAARVELFLIERILLGDGETQGQKCSAYQRAEAHAYALGLSPGASPAAGAPPPPRLPLLNAADLPPAWSSTWAAAQEHYASQHRLFRRELCTQATPVSRANVRRQLDQKLVAELSATLESFFRIQQSELAAVQAQFTSDFKSTILDVPRSEIFALQRRVTNAATVFNTVERDELKLREVSLKTLQDKTAQLVNLLASDGGPQNTLAAYDAELAAMIKQVTELLAVARSIGGIRVGGMNEPVKTCSALPAAYQPDGREAELSQQLDACIGAALALRKHLTDSGEVPRARALFVSHLRNLSTAYLRVNRM